MKKLLLLLTVLLTGVGGAWAQLSSITNNGLYCLQFSRTDQTQVLRVKNDLTHDIQNNTNPLIAAVFQFIETGETNTYYIKELSSGKYVYATKTTDSGTGDLRRVDLGGTSLPANDESATQSEKLSAYKWVVNYVGTMGCATNAWTIKPYQNTSTYWAVWSQTAANPVAFYSGTTNKLDYYIWRFLQFVTPTLANYIEANYTFSQIKEKGYTGDDIAEYYKPTYLDKVGWPTTATYNTFKTAINALADDAVISTAYVTPYNTMCCTILAPQLGKFYRITDKDGNTVYASGINTQLLTAASVTNPVSSVFYIAGDESTKRIISYLSGYYLYNTSSSGTASVRDVPGPNYSYKFDHITNHQLGALRIKNSSGDCWYSYNGININSSYNTNANRAFYFEEVTSLPITFKGEYASFYSPVDLTIPDGEGITAYTGELNGAKDALILTEIMTGTLPANTGVILHMDGWTAETIKQFPVLSTVNAGGTGSLRGTFPAASVTTETTMVLGKDESDNWGIYKYTGTVLGGFRAYMNVSDLSPSVKGLSFVFPDADGIESVLGAGAKVQDSEIYNIAGQRVNKATKGLYIMNGKKVLVK